MREFILASASPRRSELLAAAGFNFKICTADIVEDEDPNGDPQKAVAYNAREKALAVAKQFPDAIVLGADTTVALGNVVKQTRRYERSARHAQKTWRKHSHRLHGRLHRLQSNTTLR